jgi:DNA modification methylase
MTITLLCGDALALMKDLPIESIDAVIADPPYGMKCDTDWTRFSGGSQHSIAKRGKGRDYNAPIVGDSAPFDPSPWLDFPRVVLFGFQHFAARLPVGSVLVWIKRNDAAFGSFLSDAELAWMKGGHGVYCRRDLSNNTIARSRVHPTQKPVSLMEWCIDKAKVPLGATVLDPYAGSFTTAIACMRTGRSFIGCEIAERYF